MVRNASPCGIGPWFNEIKPDVFVDPLEVTGIFRYQYDACLPAGHGQKDVHGERSTHPLQVDAIDVPQGGKDIACLFPCCSGRSEDTSSSSKRIQHVPFQRTSCSRI